MNAHLGRVLLWACLAVYLATAPMGGCSRTKPVQFDTTYQAILLTSGDAYFGKLEGYGTPTPVLTDVYYVQRQANPEKKQIQNILLKRGKEWHAPEKMYLNPAHILFVEPVSEGSAVAQLIAQEKSGVAATVPSPQSSAPTESSQPPSPEASPAAETEASGESAPWA